MRNPNKFSFSLFMYQSHHIQYYAPRTTKVWRVLHASILFSFFQLFFNPPETHYTNNTVENYIIRLTTAQQIDIQIDVHTILR